MNKHFPDYLAVTWRGTLPPDPVTGEMALFFSVAGNNGVVRLRIPRESAEIMARSVLTSWSPSNQPTHSQSPGSSEIPNAPISTPEEHA